jgi:4-hydroxythreonine-4-phosphate dehydrogenase
VTLDRRPIVAVSMGDPYGVGPEVLALALANPTVRRTCRPLVFGDETVLALAAKRLRVKLPASGVVSLTSLANRSFRFGHPPRMAGRATLGYLEAAVAAVKVGRADALCTGPVHKKQLAEVGFRHLGHTEYLQESFRAKRVVMMLVGPTLRVALATVHVPLMQVVRELRRKDLSTTLGIVERALRVDFGIARPHIAVTGLNPHAGEGGLLGTEERRIIEPAIKRARAKGLRVEGPFPADSLFGRQVRTGEFDAIVAMSHDQGLGPLKALDFDRAVNVTLGLPWPRTSPDHGTAYDIAGKGIAEGTSMIEAMLLAAKLGRRNAERRGG